MHINSILQRRYCSHFSQHLDISISIFHSHFHFQCIYSILTRRYCSHFYAKLRFGQQNAAHIFSFPVHIIFCNSFFHLVLYNQFSSCCILWDSGTYPSRISFSCTYLQLTFFHFLYFSCYNKVWPTKSLAFHHLISPFRAL